MPSLTKLISLVAAASMTVSAALNTAAPQNDVNGLLFLVNREYTVSEAYEPGDLEMSDVPGQVRRMRSLQGRNRASAPFYQWIPFL